MQRKALEIKNVLKRYYGFQNYGLWRFDLLQTHLDLEHGFGLEQNFAHHLYATHKYERRFYTAN